MKIDPIKQKQYHTNFKSLKYKNGIKTQNSLNPNMKEFLSKNEERINSMKNIDIIVDENKPLMLGIKNTRYLDKQYGRFYDNNKYSIIKFDDGVIDVCSSDSAYQHCRRRLKPTEIQGIYNVSIANVFGFYQLGNEDYYDFNSPENTLKFAELLNSASEQIDEAETLYGMNCVEVLENVDKDTEFGHRMDIIDQINNTYTFIEDDLPEKMSTRDLEDLYAHKDIVDGFKSFGIHITVDNFATPEIHDKKGYIDEKYSDFYKKNGYSIYKDKRYNRYIIAPINDKYTHYTLFQNENHDNKYRCYVDFYDGGSNLSTFGGDLFDHLVKFINMLDIVAESIENTEKN